MTAAKASSSARLRKIIKKFREMRADSPERAQSLAMMGLDSWPYRRAAESLARNSILKRVSAQTYYLDEEAYRRFRQFQYNLLGVMVVILLVIMILPLVL